MTVPGRLDLTRFSLRQQGLLLVGFLLFIELAMFFTLYMQLRSAEDQAQHEQKSKEIVSRTNSMVKNMYTVAMSIQRSSDTTEMITALDEQSQNISKTVQWLKNELKGQRDQMRYLNKMDESLGPGLKILHRARTDLLTKPKSEMREVADRASGELGPHISEFFISVNSFLEAQRRSINRDIPRKQQALRKQTMNLLWVGLALNVGIAIAAAVFFTRSISSKIAILVENTDRLKEGKDLLPVMEGRDEISGLDQVFHQMAKELDEAQQLRQAFVAMISHELRTPLSSLKSFLQVLNMGAYGEVPNKASKPAREAERSVQRLILLINDLLDMEKLEAGKLDIATRAFCFDEAYEKVIDAIGQYALQHEVTIDSRIDKVQMFADPDRIVQVLVNLISNAVKFSPRGGTVIVEAKYVDASVEVRVKDNGRGIPAKYHEAIFERFRQIDSTDATLKGGTGLGLPICKAIIEQHGGTIGVESAEEQGSVFWFRVSRAEAPMEAEEKQEELSKSGPNHD